MSISQTCKLVFVLISIVLVAARLHMPTLDTDCRAREDDQPPRQRSEQVQYSGNVSCNVRCKASLARTMHRCTLT